MPSFLRRGSGSLRQRVELRSLGETRQDDGSRVDTWSTDREVWAAVEPLKEAERVAGQRVEGLRTHRIRLRSTPDNPVRADQRFYWQDRGRQRVFEIDGIVDAHERHVETVCQCVEIENDGERL